MSDDGPVWEKDGKDWPNRSASRFVEAAGLTWHVQQMGRGPALLLVHGTGAATHSWRGLAPLLAERFSILAPDLPGHGFTAPMARRRPTLTGMALALAELLRVLGFAPDLVAGHSAGAAILVRMTLDTAIAPKAVISLNGALLPLSGMAGQLFSPLAKLFVANPFLPRLFAWGAGDRRAVERLIRDTGSTLNEEGADLYLRLLRRPGHVSGALAMMANWDLHDLARELPRLRVPLVLAVGSNDKAVSPEQARQVRKMVRGATIETLRGLGHLAHEERPAEAAALFFKVAERIGLPTLT